MAVSTTSPFEHPGRNLQKAVCLRAVQSAAEKYAIGLLDDRVNPNLLRKPGMMRVQNLTPDGPVGVLKPCCTTPTDRTRASMGSHQPSLQPAPTGAKPRTDSTYKRGQIGGAGQFSHRLGRLQTAKSAATLARAVQHLASPSLAPRVAPLCFSTHAVAVEKACKQIYDQPSVGASHGC